MILSSELFSGKINPIVGFFVLYGAILLINISFKFIKGVELTSPYFLTSDDLFIKSKC